MTVSFEVSNEDRDKAPPFADGCPECVFPGYVIPHATVTSGDSLVAFYRHGRCGHEWYTTWAAQWDHTWRRVVGGEPTQRRIAGPAPERRALPSQRVGSEEAA